MKMRILGPERFCVLLGVSLQLLLLLPDTSSTAATWSQSGPLIPLIPRLQLSHTELHGRNSSSVFWDRGVSGGYQALLLDEDRGWLLVGGRDHVYLLHSNSLALPTRTIYWPAATEHVEHCRLAGKNLSTDCANYVRLLQPFNKTHVYVCGTGAYHPQCTYIDLGRSIEEPSFHLLSHAVESGRGKCPFSPREPFTARLTGKSYMLYKIIETEIVETEVVETEGVETEVVETEIVETEIVETEIIETEIIEKTKALLGKHNMYTPFKVMNDVGGKRSLINRWSTFLKARLVCSVPGPAGLDTQFDELEDVFMLETKDSQNPIIYGVFSTSSSVFRGSAVCVYSMASIRAAFNGPFAHKEGPDYRWVEYKGRIPYPRPGTCPSVTYDPLHKSTRDFPDDVVSFMRGHHLMWEPILPVTRRPVFTLVNVSYTLRKLVVDRVDAVDGQYDVLHLGTGKRVILIVYSIMKGHTEPEEIILEQLTVFQNHAPILSMELSTKRGELYVSSDEGVAQLPLQRCELYGRDCADCCLARDPYCVWDGNTCNRYFPSNKRRARRQDVKHGDSMSQCHNAEDGSESVELKVIYGVQSSSTFLECMPRSQQATVKWTVQPSHTRTSRELLQSEDRMVHMKRGLLVQRLEPGDAGLYSCTTLEHSFSQVQARYNLQVIPQQSMTASQARASDPGAGGAGLRGGPGGPGSHTQRHTKLLRNYKDLHMVGMASMSANEYCEQLWYREKKKLRQLKWKQSQVDNGKARVRRHDSTPLQ
ncbi:semaphorin-3D-like [Salvelinus sp. IW2-2015]|uniref:semaphorin-3D-like n=1 Tax=Salvelinus sp. IW2-2015 TaxID=2691554 RepID=UPI0038D4D48A